MASVTVNALMKRINRILAKEGEQLRSLSTWDSNLGNYYVTDTRSNRVERAHCDLEKLGRELGALKQYENLAAA